MPTTEPTWEQKLLLSLKNHAVALEAELASTLTRQTLEQRALAVLTLLQPLIGSANPEAGAIVAEAVTALQKVVATDKAISAI